MQLSDPRHSHLAFVASGGASKALAFHAGALRALAERGFTFRSGLKQPAAAPGQSSREIDSFIGSSAGAVVSAFVVSGRTPQEICDLLLRRSQTLPFPKPWQLLGVQTRSLLAQVARFRSRGQRASPQGFDFPAPVTMDGVAEYMRKHVLKTDRFSDLWAGLYLVATHVDSLRKVIFGPLDSRDQRDSFIGPRPAEEAEWEEAAYPRYCNDASISQALLASISVPQMVRPCAIKHARTGQTLYYFDGEIRESVSVHVARDIGAEFCIVSDIWVPYRFDARVGSLAEMGTLSTYRQAFYLQFEQRAKEFIRQSRRVDKALKTIDELETHGYMGSDIAEGIRVMLCGLMRHRSMSVLYVQPDETDHAFFFESLMSFSKGHMERCIDAGHRAALKALQRDPAFLEALDRGPAA